MGGEKGLVGGMEESRAMGAMRVGDVWGKQDHGGMRVGSRKRRVM